MILTTMIMLPEDATYDREGDEQQQQQQ